MRSEFLNVISSTSAGFTSKDSQLLKYISVILPLVSGVYPEASDAEAGMAVLGQLGTFSWYNVLTWPGSTQAPNLRLGI
ncbi:hypothetical protein CEUSTIGMA_g1551.t1 [Chlamydomonas eustigma]|uniref:Uncharacterized protein n=1 Tax=Chlamydomonas eustigma TaxID=1157962 RepID=A0A250WTY4_9CHLO|nr:hypothetical protein CEUSTIGMA_g1551.t1 [Chlamydomonas eustigma]|eukprot:GAX74102.1 hypothetical protein CEUSTIGMA_g1551.t1 [Chlamydomonas eustigma]